MEKLKLEIKAQVEKLIKLKYRYQVIKDMNKITGIKDDWKNFSTEELTSFHTVICLCGLDKFKEILAKVKK